MRWFIIDGTRKRGPYTATEIHRMLCSGEVAMDTFVLREGSSIRRKLIDVPELIIGEEFNNNRNKHQRIPVEDHTRFAAPGEEMTEQSDPQRGGTQVAAASELAAEAAPKPLAPPKAESRKKTPKSEPKKSKSERASPPAQPSLSFDLDSLSPEQIFQSIAMPAKRENASQLNNPFEMGSWNLLNAGKPPLKKERKSQNQEHLASPDLLVRPKSPKGAPKAAHTSGDDAAVVMATFAKGLEKPPPKPTAPKKEKEKEILVATPPRIKVPKNKPELYQKRGGSSSKRNNDRLNLSYLLLAGAGAALVLLLAVVLLLKKPSKQSPYDAQAPLIETAPSDLPNPPAPLVAVPAHRPETAAPVHRPEVTRSAPDVPLEDAFAEPSEGKPKRKHRKEPSREIERPREPSKIAKTEQRPSPRKPHLAARAPLVPAGWPAAAASGRELAKGPRITTVVGLKLGPLPPQCSPCHIRGTLPDGTQVVLVSQNLAMWKSAGASTGEAVAVKGLVIRRTAGEFWLVLQGVSAR